MLSYAGVISRFISVKRDIFRGKSFHNILFLSLQDMFMLKRQERARRTEEYVTQNKLSASDYKMLKKWGYRTKY